MTSANTQKTEVGTKCNFVRQTKRQENWKGTFSKAGLTGNNCRCMTQTKEEGIQGAGHDNTRNSHNYKTCKYSKTTLTWILP